MNSVTVYLLVALAVLLATNRRQLGNAKTLAEMWEPARANGWRRGTGLAVAGVVLFAVKLLGALTLFVLTVAATAIKVVAFVASAVQEHLMDLLNPPAVIARTEAA